MVLHQPDGGRDYYGRFPEGLPTDEGYFPIGVWFESLLSSSDVALDLDAGLNTYVELTENSDIALARESGLYVLPSFVAEGANGFVVTDEPDMWAGAGSAEWAGRLPGEGEICRPPGSGCGFTVIRELRHGLPREAMTYINFGKGVAFWHDDQDARAFVATADVVSVDTYWFTDPNICGAHEGGRGRDLLPSECRAAANYGWSVQRVRDLVSPSGSKPVWAFVEVGHPFEDSQAPTITAAEVRAAVWHSVIAGARGVVYFNHNFGGECISQHVLRDACGAGVRDTVAAVNHQIAELAPHLNSPSAEGLVEATAGVATLVKVRGSEVTVVAASRNPDGVEAHFAVPCAGNRDVRVLGEARTRPMTEGVFSDSFEDGNAVHIYRIDGRECLA